jgi:hypothetical protein
MRLAMMRASEIALILGASALFFFIEAQNRPDHQEWGLKRAGTEGKAHLTLDVSRNRPGSRSRWRNSQDVSWSTIRGLKAEDLDRFSGAVKFDIVRDAGALHCEGRASVGRASGKFLFEPDPGFSKKLGDMGYFPPSEDQLFSMMMSDLTLEFARLVADAGMRASTKELLDLRNHGVDARYIEQVRAAGFSGISAREMIQLRDHGVRPEFLRDLKDSGYAFSTREAVMLRDHGVSSEFISDLRAAGYNDLSAEDIRDLRNHGVGGDDLRALKSQGLSPTPRDLIEFKNHGIGPGFLKSLRETGNGDLSVRDIVNLQNHGVSAEFLREVHALGYSFSADDLVRLRDHGVNGDYLRKLKDAGFQHLPADKIVKLRDNGVE